MIQEMIFSMEEFDDFTIMSFGPYKGFELGNIPASYLLNIYRMGETDGSLKECFETHNEKVSEKYILYFHKAMKEYAQQEREKAVSELLGLIQNTKIV